MYMQQDLNPYINNLRFISSFAEEYHCQFDEYYYWKRKEEKFEEDLKYRGVKIVWSVILLVVGLINLILGIRYFENNGNIPDFLNNLIWDDVFWDTMAVMSIIVAVVKFIACVILIIDWAVLYPRKEKLRKNAVKNKELFKAEIDRYKTSSAFAHQRDIYVTYFPDCKARKSEIDYLIFVMQTGRAATFKEALILLDEKKYSDEMKEIAEKTMEYARRAANKPSGSTVNNYYYR